jgi:hypothetical protein
MKEFTTDEIINCARCGEKHIGVVFKPFTKQINISEDEFYTHWAMCPKLNEPILGVTFIEKTT